MSDRVNELAASVKHPHEPDIPPALDPEGRCLVCGLLVEIAALTAERDHLQKRLDGSEEIARHQAAEIDALAAAAPQLADALERIEKHSLLEIRRAAFAPEIGTRMSENWRADIANQCRALEDFVRAALASYRQTQEGK